MRQPLMLCGKSLSGFPKHRSRMPEHILPSPQKARSAFPKSLSGTKEKSCPSHVWTYITGCQANTRNAHKQRICVREPLPSAVGRSRGVEDGREWIIMHILNAYRCKHVCFWEYIILLCADEKSRDAKSCVSQARMRNKQMRNMAVITALFARETQGWAINKCDYMSVIAAFFARETQDFASLQGWRRHIL